MQTQTNSIPLPRALIADSQQIFEDMGLSLDVNTRLAILQDVYAKSTK